MDSPRQCLRVAVLDDYQGYAVEALCSSAVSGLEISSFPEHIDDEDDLVRELQEFDVVVAMRERTAFPASVISRLPRLRLLVTTGERNAAIDVAAAEKAGVTVCGTRILTSPTVELTWALILALLRRIPQADAAMRAGRWQEHIGDGLAGRTLAILGLGRIGTGVARVGAAFGMRIVAWSPHLEPGRASAVGATAVSLESLFRQADVVTIHLRVSAGSEAIVGEPQLRLLKPTSYLVNTSRAHVVDQGALERVLFEGAIAGAAIDVFEQEPLAPEHPALTWPNTVITPHVGYVVRENYELFFDDVREDIVAFLAGRPVRVISQ